MNAFRNAMTLAAALAAVLVVGSAAAQVVPTLPQTSQGPDGKPRASKGDLATLLGAFANTKDGVLVNPTVTGGTIAGSAIRDVPFLRGTLTNSVLVNPSIQGGVMRLGVPGWLNAIVPNTENNTNAFFASVFGGNGATGACRTSDNPNAGSQGCQALAGFAINNNGSAVQTAYGAYFEARRLPGAGATHGFEANVLNLGNSVVPTNSYTPIAQGMTPAAWLSCGRTDVANNAQCSAALGVVNNGAEFLAGIVFGNTSLHDFGGYSVAIDMAKGMEVAWREPSTGSIAGQLRSDVTIPGGGGQIVYADDGIHIQNPSGQDAIRFNTNTTVDVPGSFSVGGCIIISGTGVPTGIAAPVCTLYLRKDGSAGNTLYIKEANPGSGTGWTAK